MEPAEISDFPIGDFEYFVDLASKAGEKLARDLMDCAAPALEKEYAVIVTAIEEGDSALLKRACHSLKGACYSVQMRRLAQCTRILESLVDDIDEVRAQFPQFKTVYDETMAWWEETLKRDLMTAEV